MFTSQEEALRFIKDEKVEMIDLTFTDLIGRLHHITVPAASFNEKIFSNGIAFDSSSIPGFKTKGGSDIILIPDENTGRIDPFWSYKTLAFTGSSYEAGSRQPFHRDPRNVLKKAVEYFHSLKIADGCYFSPEYEFYIFDGIKIINEINHSEYLITSEEAGWRENGSDFIGNGQKIPLQEGYHAMPPRDRCFNTRSEMVKQMVDEGIKVKYHHHEVGAAGQLEIEVLFEEPLKAADQGTQIKYIAKMVAERCGKTITFMPKPLYNAAGSGMHFHQFLHANGKSIFYKDGGYANLSDTALNYIGGLLDHTPAVMGFTNPSTNSYKRLIPGFEAPTKIFFGLANRSACIRIPKYDDNDRLKRIEFRPGDGTGNLYLAIAAQLLAGLNGIKNKTNPTEKGFGPIDRNVLNLPLEEQNRIKSVPANLKEAMTELDKDRTFLTSSGAFTDDLINGWIEYKLQKEYYRLFERPHPYELEMYFDL